MSTCLVALPSSFPTDYGTRTLLCPCVCAVVLALLSYCTLETPPNQYMQSSLIAFSAFHHMDAHTLFVTALPVDIWVASTCYVSNSCAFLS